ncbi:MAG: hypothetical protein R3E56_00420 [Burkholderiaceae bacterium]
MLLRAFFKWLIRVLPRIFRWVLPGLLVGVLVGCGTVPGSAMHDEAGTDASSCRRWYANLDRLVRQLGVEDVQDARLEGFPQLRQSRFVASFRTQAQKDDAAFDAWFDQMRKLGDQGSAVEMRNVPVSAWRSMLPLASKDARAEAVAKTRACAEQLSRDDRLKPERRALLLAQAGVPDSYSTTARVLGLYALTRWPFSAGVRRWQEETAAVFAHPSDGSAAIGGARYVPEGERADDPDSDLQQVERDALGIPQLSDSLKQRLLDHHAPVLRLASMAPFDRLGEIVLTHEGRPEVVPDRHVVYRRVAFVRDGPSTLVQLVYLYWFSERPKNGPLDLLGGTLDGVMWRVTLDERGRPLVYDTAHACGCYHMFFPTGQLVVRPAPEPGVEWAFVPSLAPQRGAGERIDLRLDPGTHYLSAVSSTSDLTGTPYIALDADQLRSLPLGLSTNGDDDRRSLYGPDGIVAGTQRGERYLFWPMGVRDAGAQRQWGHHATAFVGRRHFDDPDLIERRFRRIAADGLNGGRMTDP